MMKQQDELLAANLNGANRKVSEYLRRRTPTRLGMLRRANQRWYKRNRMKVLAKKKAQRLADPQKFLKRDTEWRYKNPMKWKHNYLKRNYGVTIQQFEAAAEQQAHRCWICLKQTTLFVDHCHKTKKFRALLCRPCNSLLGFAQDSIPTLERALLYLKEHTQPSAEDLVD